MTSLRRCLASLFLTSGIAAVDMALGERVVLSGLLVLGPVLACVHVEKRCTLVVGGYALLLFVAMSQVQGTLGTFNTSVRVLTLGIGVCMAVCIAHMRAARERTLATVARTAQQALLTPLPPRVGYLLVATRYRCAARDLVLGGDVLDAVSSAYGVRVLIADVRGSGLSAMGTAAATLRHFRNAAYAQRSLLSVTGAVAAAVSEELGAEDFVTATIAEFAPDGQVTIVNCGHHPPAVLGERGARLIDVEPALPLGLHGDYREEKVRLAPGERMLFYTDGLAEARDAEGTMLDLEHELRTLPHAPVLDGVLDDLFKRMDSHTGGRHSDDVSMILCQPDP
ncbi:PP2C family protein-serine/threonine phosphatase [Streptomyces sp. TRM68416]|uniref:PP2C family protein-serine/threonine phosphatase n=1 Tax=Streptomyces sp. TRM68416 TaxID=2758412 RepID=UPI001661B0F4|nr:PP2C family protein-serine/threonine phosphatase [Streptomyces sp. TRM68416]MBD0839841.1 serine/threonine-protein phosphatase [Streptomyces sp. TRM68416]